MVLCVPVQLLFLFQACVVWGSSLTAQLSVPTIFIPILPIYRLVCPYRQGVKVKKTADRNLRVHARQGPAASHFIFPRDTLTPHGHLLAVAVWSERPVSGREETLRYRETREGSSCLLRYVQKVWVVSV